MKCFSETKLQGVLVRKLPIYNDARGSFVELVNLGDVPEELADKFIFKQDNLSISSQNVLRGLHYQIEDPQGKLVTCLQGRILDVIVDINPVSPTFLESIIVELDSKHFDQIWIPAGYAHGFYVLSDICYVGYKCTELYQPKNQRGLRWDDPNLQIDWPCTEPVLSEQDKTWPLISRIDWGSD